MLQQRDESLATSPGPDDDLRVALRDLAARVARLERELVGTPRGDPLWALRVLRSAPSEGGGDVIFAGVADTPGSGRIEWMTQRAVRDLLTEDWGDMAGVVAALGHPVRLELLRALLRGSQGVRDLSDLPGMGTSGQLYHHLRELQNARWVRQERRNHYVIPADRVLPVLVVIAAAAGLALPGGEDARD